MTHWQVREAEARDADAVAALHIQGWWAYRGLLPDWWLDDPARAMACVQRWRAQLARPAGERATAVWVATDGQGRVVGFVRFGPTADPPSRSQGLEADEVWDLWVDPEVRSQGVGSTLLREALRRCRRPVVVWVLRDNLRGRAFYAREGAVDDLLVRTERIEVSGHSGFDVVDVRMRWAGEAAR
ncbi:GNAT family N-acetyltransferase [Aestuariimicrobium ganziense]|uniref:GNAT family N-acetyltransferase n=1 Tax=Aestuariimicrobium ganziense TaxID=2773677 RepID=UPI0019448265|nr:GNAT family N-acetyltransferase [Aestuariimicrobium ganziense]